MIISNNDNIINNNAIIIIDIILNVEVLQWFRTGTY